tara:strand:- start:378 stop:713 length:336 start_codon:yes stop_codon:yes gene_type:complete
MGSIQGGIAKVSTDSDHLAIAVENVQTLVIQAREQDALMAYSEPDLENQYSRLKLSQFEAVDGTNSSGLVLTFPHSGFSGTLFFRSTSDATESRIVVWSVKCGHKRMQGGY